GLSGQAVQPARPPRDDPAPLAGGRGEARLNVTARVLACVALVLASGCARPDLLQQTWAGRTSPGTWESTGDIFIVLTLEQRGQRVTGAVLRPNHLAGTIDGSVAGDELRFHQKNAIFEGQMTVSGVEMSGTLRLS